jgi:hypothetical protein
MEAVRVLADEIGPRPPCSEGEQRAARWCAARLQARGLQVQVEAFESRPTAAPMIASYLAVSAAAALLLAALPLLAFVAGIAALVLYARDVDGRPLVPARGGTSHNVVARRGGSTPPVLVVVAELDSGWASPRFGPRFPPGPRGWAIAVHGALVLVPAIAAAAWVAESTRPLPSTLWLVALVLTAVLAGAGASELYASRKRQGLDGANDNASGVAVLLQVADRFVAPDVWWVLVGSAHSGNIGMQRFLDLHAHELGEARILSLVGVGAGRLTAPAEDGMLRPRRADAPLIDAAVEAGAEMRSLRTVQSAAAVALVRQRPALTIAGLDERGSIAHQGLPSDSVDRIDDESLDRATDLVARVVEVFTGHADAGRPRRPHIDGTSPA